MLGVGSTTDGVPVSPVTEASPEVAAQVARVTAAAYEVGDLVPGLPVADGATETASSVLDGVAAGRRLWVAWEGDAVAGSVRASPRPDGTWEVQRLAVGPRVRRGGVGRALLDRMAADAAAEGVPRLVLDAVVERGNPAFYARVGFRTVRHFPASDKLLSEVHMTREVGRPAVAVPFPEPGDEPPSGAVVHWWAHEGGTRCRVGAAAAIPLPPGLFGVDCLPGGDPAAVLALLAAEADEADGDRLSFARPAGRVAAFAQPRRVRPDLLAWWRSPAARTAR